MLTKLAARDLVIITLMIGIWIFERRLTSDDGLLFWLLTIVAGLGCALVGFVLHEWGHLLGSRLSGSVVHLSPSLKGPLLFHFDTSQNNRRQFMWMSWGGYLASAAWLTFVLTTVGTTRWSDRIAIVVVLIGVVGTFIAEVPTTVRVWRGAPLPTSTAFRKQ